MLIELEESGWDESNNADQASGRAPNLSGRTQHLKGVLVEEILFRSMYFIFLGCYSRKDPPAPA